MQQAEEVLDFWFGPQAGLYHYPTDKAALWFKKSVVTDELIRSRFGALVASAQRAELQAWVDDPRARLALVILLDQFSRNIYRDTPAAFAGDALTTPLVLASLAKGDDRDMTLIERVFFYLPLEHAESLELQDQSVAAYEGLVAASDANFRSYAEGFLDYARRHREVIVRFGRFPHRNAILGRSSSADEQSYLRQPGSGF